MEALAKSLSTNQPVGEVCNNLPTLAEEVFEMEVGDDCLPPAVAWICFH